MDKVRLKKERAPIYPIFFWRPVIWLIITTNNAIVTNHAFILEDPYWLEIQVKVFIMFLYISRFILERIYSLSENFIKTDDNRIPFSL